MIFGHLNQQYFTYMHSESRRRHVFISHHHADDTEVNNLIALLSKSGHDIRNSSIRAKPANQRRLDKGLIKDETIQRLLHWKISWAGTVVVLIGKDTYSRGASHFLLVIRRVKYQEPVIGLFSDRAYFLFENFKKWDAPPIQDLGSIGKSSKQINRARES